VVHDEDWQPLPWLPVVTHQVCHVSLRKQVQQYLVFNIVYSNVCCHFCCTGQYIVVCSIVWQFLLNTETLVFTDSVSLS